MVSVQHLRECFDADPATGSLIWRIRPRDHFATGQAAGHFNAKYAGRVAGRKNGTGYILVTLHVDGKNTKLSAHRVLWAIVHGEWPKQHIDHINHDRADNRLANLRDVSRSVNMANRRGRLGTRQPATGVRQSRSGKYTAYVGGSGKQRHLGTFPTLELAIAARTAAQQEVA